MLLLFYNFKPNVQPYYSFIIVSFTADTNKTLFIAKCVHLNINTFGKGMCISNGDIVILCAVN